MSYSTAIPIATAIPALTAIRADERPTDSGEAATPMLAQPAGWRCTGCGTGYPTEQTCPSCAICDRCDQPVPPHQSMDTVRGALICPSCSQLYYWQCDECEGWNSDEDDCGNGCGDDNDENEYFDAGGLLHDDSYQPYPVFHGSGPLYLGPEIEVEADDRDECAAIALDHLGELGYLKTDGSLKHGFEIVTHPMSYAWAMGHFPWPMLTDLDDAGCYTTSGTGLHLHLSRAGFAGPAHVYRWMKLVYRNQTPVIALAGRHNSEYAAFEVADRRAVVDYAKGSRGAFRYRAINTTNTTTFELRIFASSLDIARVQAAFGFAAASVDYTRELTIRQLIAGGWGWAAFTDWLAGQPAYRPLTERLQELPCAC